MTQKQYGASMGGPIARNRTFYFSNVEQRRLDQTGLTTISRRQRRRRSTRGCGGRVSRLAGLDRHLSESGRYDDISWRSSITSSTAAISSAFAIRSTTSSRSNSRGAGALNAPTASSGLDNLDQSLAFSNTLTLSSRTVNETRFQFAHGDLKALPSDPIGPAVSIAGVASFGTLVGKPAGDA